MKTTPKNAVIREAISYGRFSSAEQSEGDSITRQEEAFKAVCFRYQDRMTPSTRFQFGHFFGKGESGFHAANLEDGGSLRNFLDLIEDGTVDPKTVVLVIEMWSRFGRTAPDLAVKLLSDIVRSGCIVAVYSPDYWVDVEYLESQGVSMITMCLQMAHAESKEKARIAKANQARIRENGVTKKGKKPATCPFWLDVNKDGVYQENDYADTVREMFRLAELGNGTDDVAKLTAGAGKVANELKNPTRTIHRTVNGKKVKVQAKIDVLGVLRNRAVIGEYQPTVRTGKDRIPVGDVKKGFYPVVITPEQFNAVQSGLDSRKKARGRRGKFISNLFTELFVGDDGERMHIKINGCGQKHLRRKTRGANRGWEYNQIESTLIRFLTELKLTGTASSPLQGYQDEKAQAVKNLASLTKRLEENPESEMIAGLGYKAEKRIKELEAKIVKEEQRIPETTSLAHTHAILKELETAKGEELLALRTKLKMLIRRLVARIDVKYQDTKLKARTCALTIHLTNGETRLIGFKGLGTNGQYTIVKDSTGKKEWISIKAAPLKKGPTLKELVA